MRGPLIWISVSWFTLVAHAYAEPAAREAIYRYKNSKGRVVYTNTAEQVPLEQRADAPVDLSRVSLNTELGNEIRQRLEREHAALTKTPYCERLRATAQRPFWEQLWEQYAVLISIAGLLLVLILLTPLITRRFGAEGWSKALGFAIPAIFAGGLIVFSLDKTQESVSKLRARAQPCSEGALGALGSGQGALQKHAELVDRLKRDMAAVDAESAR